jgi:hypothetical protein
MSFQSFGQGFKDGFTGSIVQAIVITAVLGSLISAAIASGGVVALLATELAQALAAFGAGASLGEFAYIMSNFCGDERDYRLGVLLGQIAASLTPGVVLGVLGKLAGRIPGSGGGCSFAAGTPVTTEEGDKPIEQVKTGDKVLSRNEKTGEQSYHRVLQTFATPDDEIYSLQLQTAGGKQETLQVTGNHPFWLKGKGWTETDLLKPNDQIAAKDGQWLNVTSLQQKQEKSTAYNFEVDTDHTYFVGNSQALVHNDCTDVARDLQKKLGGGEIFRIEPKDAPALYPDGYPDGQKGWAYHDVFLKDGMVYDPMTLGSDKPIPLAQWKEIFGGEKYNKFPTEKP